jgi:hypothetical protein
MDSSHPDYAQLQRLRDALVKQARGHDRLVTKFPELVRDAIEYVIDPIRTGRTTIADLDNVEKTFVGLKVEHFIRDFLDVPKGVRDLVIDGENVDVKNTIATTWTIPKETYDEEGPCLLIAVADETARCWLGLILARNAYLGAQNRDKKRQVTVVGRQNIMWLVDGLPFPPSAWAGFDMGRFRELRTLKPGSLRAATFFEENLDRVVNRRVVQSLLFDQKDYMKRLRGNGGARDILAPKGISLLSGIYDQDVLTRRCVAGVTKDDMIAIRT